MNTSTPIAGPMRTAQSAADAGRRRDAEPSTDYAGALYTLHSIGLPQTMDIKFMCYASANMQ